MKKNLQITDYGIYIDHSHYVIVTVKNGMVSTKLVKTDFVGHERFAGEGTDKTSIAATLVSDRKSKRQNKTNEEFKKICKSIVKEFEHANRILVFGPSEAKYELQNEIRNTKQLKEVFEEIKTTNKMSEGEVRRYVAEHFSSSVKAE